MPGPPEFGYTFLKFGIGGPGNDTITGGAASDVLMSADGQDLFIGNDGNDLIFAGPDPDTLNGGAGDDYLFGEDGDDLLDGGTGSDLLDGGAGANTILDAPGVSGLTVNAGEVQRSRITMIAVAFDAALDASLFQNPGAVTLSRVAGGLATAVTIGGGLVVTPGAGSSNTISLTFSNTSNPGIDSGSLSDGQWQLAIPSLSYTTLLDDPTLRRLFGDADANGTVDAADFAAFGSTLGSS